MGSGLGHVNCAAQNGSETALADLTALVTGGARRLGRAVAEALCAEGVGVVVHYHRSEADARELVASVVARGGRAWAIRADLADEAEASRLVERAVELCGAPLDILVNSASTFDANRVMDFTAAQLAADVGVNAFAPLALCRGLAAQGRAGRIVNLLDARMVDYDREHAAYHLSKRMLFAITRMLALELAPGITVNAVAPGLVLPPAGETQDYLDRLAHTTPLQRHGSAHDVVSATLFLLRSEFITGQVLYVDGGRNLKGCMYGT
jgi:NAD(P)-dependent dehydrogenase (short-subunit alcohol dehydrogenase family)